METHTPTAADKSPRTIKEIIVHCTATPAGRPVSVAEIDRWHRQRGFDCIGYHFLVGLDGQVAVGRPIQRIGAHCRGHNAHSIGVAYVGGLDALGNAADTRTPCQRTTLKTLLTELKKRYPQARIYGHRDFVAKECPCFDATREYALL